tara:strand:+ start:311 stop:1207 length:897 start_codon:yes stop_codon:yes gene_type:complete
MEQNFEAGNSTFVNKLTKLSMEDVTLTKNRDKYIQEEIDNRVKIGKRELKDSPYTKVFFNKAIKNKRRELAEETNPLGARSGRMTKAEGGDIDSQMEMMLGAEQETPMKEQMTGVMGESEEQPTMLPDEEMEEDYVDYVVEETLSNEDRNYLIGALEQDDRLSVIFDQVIETAHEFSGSGPIKGPGSGVSDSIPARLSDGEFVFTTKATEEIGVDSLMSMMKDAEAAVDERQMAYAGGPIKEEKEVMAVPKAPRQQNINVTKATLDNGAAMSRQQEDLVGKAVKENMMLDPYQRHVRS